MYVCPPLFPRHQLPPFSPATPMPHSSTDTIPTPPRHAAPRVALLAAFARVFSTSSPPRTRPPRPCSLPPRLPVPPTCCRRARTVSAGRPPTQPCQLPFVRWLPLLPRSFAPPTATVAAAAATAAEDGAAPATPRHARSAYIRAKRRTFGRKMRAKSRTCGQFCSK